VKGRVLAVALWTAACSGEPPGFDTPESAVHDPVADVYLVSNVNGAPLAKDGNGYIHPTQVRSLSFREAARVQSFHDAYPFCGSPSDQWTQLGNAVPPVLAEAIARSFRRALERS